MPPTLAPIWLIPALPLIAAAIGALTPRRGRALAAGTAIAAMAAALLLSCAMLPGAVGASGAPATANFTWFALGRGGVQGWDGCTIRWRRY